MTKNELRIEMKAKRRVLDKEAIHSSSHSIFKALISLPEFVNSKTVMVYLSAFKEPDTAEITEYLFRENKRVVVPISNTYTFTITPSYLTSPDKLQKGAYGILEPTECITADIKDIDIALIPGIAFDITLNRTGFGKGYYDRFLSQFKGEKIGICYDFQIIDSLDTDKYDIPMDKIITEKRIIQ